VELHNGDLVRIGRAQPFVFEKRSLIPLNGNVSNAIEEAPEKDNSKTAMFPVLGVKKHLSVKKSKTGADRPGTALIKSKRTAANTAEKKLDDRGDDRRASPSSSIETNSINSLSTVSSETLH
ncbi:hypothetical protein OSTOST_18304, partial [Ostertagia ostertagi]